MTFPQFPEFPDDAKQPSAEPEPADNVPQSPQPSPYESHNGIYPQDNAEMSAEDALAVEAAAVLNRTAEIAAAAEHHHQQQQQQQEQEQVHDQQDPDDVIDADSMEAFTPRRGHTFKRPEEPPKNEQGKMICRFTNTCPNLTFERKCEWSKHMDKHERPYKCEAPGCEKLQGFTYSGGLLRHQREVHKMHGGTKEPLYCPFPNCKRNQGTGFTRKENRDEHIRRVHRRATDGLDLASLNDLNAAAKRDRETMETTDPLLDQSVQGVLASHVVPEEIGAENIDPQVTSPVVPTTKKRRITQTNGNSILDNIDGDLELKSAIKRLQESNQFLLQQNQTLRKDYQNLFERLNRLEQDLGTHLVTGACGVDIRMTDTD